MGTRVYSVYRLKFVSQFNFAFWTNNHPITQFLCVDFAMRLFSRIETEQTVSYIQFKDTHLTQGQNHTASFQCSALECLFPRGAWELESVVCPILS